MFTLFGIIYLLSAHYICDFILQNKYDAENKAVSVEALLNHTSTYSICMSLFYFIDCNTTFNWMIFMSIMFVSHSIIDFFSSRIETYLYSKNNIRGFFNVIGFDQLLHYVTIFLTLKYL